MTSSFERNRAQDPRTHRTYALPETENREKAAKETALKTAARIRVPATTANLGPGFDVLGMALDLYNEVEIRWGGPSQALLHFTGPETAELPTDSTNYVAQGAETTFRLAGQTPPFPYSLTVRQNIPISRGLGSSAAALVGGAAAANALLDEAVAPLSLVQALTEIEGHTEQLGAAMFGGLVAVALAPIAPSLLDPTPDHQAPVETVPKKHPSTKHREKVLIPLPVAEQLRFILAIPHTSLETKKARASLPDQISFTDAVQNIGYEAALLAGLQHANADLIGAGMQDRLHQDTRSLLFPAGSAVLTAARAQGAFGACWSGAGPTMLAIAHHKGKNEEIGKAMIDTFAAHNITATMSIHQIDTHGAVVLSRS